MNLVEEDVRVGVHVPEDTPQLRMFDDLDAVAEHEEGSFLEAATHRYVEDLRRLHRRVFGKVAECWEANMPHVLENAGVLLRRKPFVRI